MFLLRFVGYYSAPVPLGLGNEASTIVSLEGETSFPFHGEHHTTMAVVSNGYVTFVDSVDTSSLVDKPS